MTVRQERDGVISTPIARLTPLDQQLNSEFIPATPPVETVFKSDKFVVLTGLGNPDLAQEVGRYLGLIPHQVVELYADGETAVNLPQMRKRRAIIIQSLFPKPDSRIRELELIADATRRADAKGKITAFVPYMAYARQDRKVKRGTPISGAQVVEDINRSGIRRLATIDIHAAQLQGAWRKGVWDDVPGSYVLIPELEKYIDEQGYPRDKLVIVSPDSGGKERIDRYYNMLDARGQAMIYKKRAKANQSEAKGIAGYVRGMHTIIADDILDTGGTAANAAWLLHRKGAASITLVATHGLFSGEALERISDAPIDKVFVTNTVAQRPEVFTHPKIEVVSVAELIAITIYRQQTGQSLSELFQK